MVCSAIKLDALGRRETNDEVFRDETVNIQSLGCAVLKVVMVPAVRAVDPAVVVVTFRVPPVVVDVLERVTVLVLVSVSVTVGTVCVLVTVVVRFAVAVVAVVVFVDTVASAVVFPVVFASVEFVNVEDELVTPLSSEIDDALLKVTELIVDVR